MLKVMPLTAIKLHAAGDVFEPVSVGIDIFYLANANSVLVSRLGNAFEFKSEENALAWLSANIDRAARLVLQDEATIAALELEYQVTGRDWLRLEIMTMRAKVAGEWGVDLDTELDGGNATTIYN